MNTKLKFILFFLIVNTLGYTTCSDIRDYFPKENESLNNLELFRSGKKLERTVKKELSRRIAIEVSLAEACLKINEQGNQINKLQKAVQILSKQSEDNAVDIIGLQDDTYTIGKNMIEQNNSIENINKDIVQLAQKHSELSDFNTEITTIQDNLDDLQEDLSGLSNALENIKSNIDDVRTAIAKSSPYKHPRSPEASNCSKRARKTETSPTQYNTLGSPL